MGQFTLRFLAILLGGFAFFAAVVRAEDQTSVLTGTVVGPKGEPISQAIIKGQYVTRNRRQRGAPALIEATSDAAGKFKVERQPAALWLFVSAHDGGLAARTQVKAEDNSVTVKLAPAATVIGRLVFEDSAPLFPANVVCNARVPRTNARGQTVFATFAVSTCPTAVDGRFVFPGLIVGEEYDTLIIAGTRIRTTVGPGGTTVRGNLFPLPSFKVRVPGKIDLGYLEVPLPRRVTLTPTGTQFEIDSIELAARRFSAKTELAARILAAQQDAKREHQKVMLVVGDPKSESPRSFVALLDWLDRADTVGMRAVSYSLRPKLAKRVGIPESEVTQEFCRPLADFHRLYVNINDEAAGALLLSQYRINVPLALPVLVVLADDGSVAESRSFERAADLDGPPNSDAKLLRDFLKRHALPVLNAEDLLASAERRAREDRKRVLLQLSATGSYPSRLLTRFIDQHRQLFERDYVYVGNNILDSPRPRRFANSSRCPRTRSNGGSANLNTPRKGRA